MDALYVLCLFYLSATTQAKIVYKEKVALNHDRNTVSWNLAQCHRSYEEQNKAIQTLQETVTMHTSILKNQKEIIEKYSKQNERLSHEFEDLKKQVIRRPDTRYDLNGTGCFMDVITMNCLGNGTLSITNAIYGKFRNSSTGGCTPKPADCIVPMSEQSPTDWTALLVKCNGKTSCSHEYTGEVINECEPGYVADYMQIFYTCPPDDVVFNNAVGFTIGHPVDHIYYQGEIVEFVGVVTNIGNHYSLTNFTFTCPEKAMYMFSVSIASNYYKFDSEVAIMRDDEDLIHTWLDGSQSILMYGSASAVLVTECDVGQSVWVKTITNAYVDGDFKASHFSGALIQRL